MNIALITDAWQPQVNGVVRTWQQVIARIEADGHTVTVIHPGLFRTFCAPKYPEINLAILPGRRVRHMLDELEPDAIHIATEGPLGIAARRYCARRRLPFTTSYHTKFPQYLKSYFRIPESWTYRFMRWFHNPAGTTLVPTQSCVDELVDHGLTGLLTWSRGVDVQQFKPEPRDALEHLPRPVFLYAGRVAVEKNIEAFLKLDLPGSKVVVGDGPIREELAKQYPSVYWAGYQFGDDLARHYASADVFVFPSRTDTFGVVMLEAGACGLPVAAYPVTGPIDVVRQGITGVLDDDLRAACLGAAELDRRDCIAFARMCTWERTAGTALSSFSPIHRGPRLAPA